MNLYDAILPLEVRRLVFNYHRSNGFTASENTLLELKKLSAIGRTSFRIHDEGRGENALLNLFLSLRNLRHRVPLLRFASISR